ncbi:MAG: hypothetical protein LBQ31_10330, partial [Bacteroidales bacterium]|nr:hypothetical protein [Bacteroidales bacterium]
MIKNKLIKKNMIFKYLWYKIYRAALKSSLKEAPFFLAALSFSLLIHISIVEVNVLLAKLDILPFMYRKDDQIMPSVISVILAALFY